MAENLERKQRGKGRPFKPGESGNPSGKPPGAKNRATRLAQTLLDGEEEALVRKVIELAKGGDMQALKVCLDRLGPPQKPQSALGGFRRPVVTRYCVSVGRSGWHPGTGSRNRRIERATCSIGVRCEISPIGGCHGHLKTNLPATYTHA